MSTETAPRRALVLIDVQNDYDGGALAISHPPFAESIGNIARAMDAAHANGVPIVAVRQMAPPTSPYFTTGTRGGELHDAVGSRPYDHFIEKKLPSAFAGTDLETYLRANGIDTITIAGYMTHNCDLSTIIHAVHMGFEVEFLSDATGSLAYVNSAGSASAEEIHRVMSVVFQSRFAAVCATRDWIAHMADGTRPKRDTIAASHQRALPAERAA